jgi:hypothetical protein
MTLLSPWTFAAALAAAGLSILLLHMLKLRRRRRDVSTTLLWRRTVEDLVANAPFQRLRWSMLLLMQLLAAAALALALGRPASPGAASLGGRITLLVDRSASMNALLDDPAATSPELRGAAEPSRRTRLDAAVDAARRVISRLHRGQEALIIAFASRPTALGGFQSSRERLLSMLDQIKPTDEEADLGAALELASAFARSASATSSEDLAAPEALPTVLLFSDGNVRPPEDGAFEVAAGALEVFLAGGADEARSASSSDQAANVGITGLVVERRYDDPASAELFARLQNSGAATVECLVSLRADDRTILRRIVEVPGRQGTAPGEATLDEKLDLPGQALLVLELTHRDRLASDDVAAALLPGPHPPRLLLVAPGDGPDPFLVAVLEALLPPRDDPASGQGTNPSERDEPSAALRVITAEQWNAGQRVEDQAPDPSSDPSSERSSDSSSDPSADPVADLVIFDRVQPSQRPELPSLTIGSVPPWLGRTDAADPERARRVLSWERQHPLLRHVDLDELVYSATGAFAMDGPAADGIEILPLVLGSDGPVVVATEERGVRHLSVAFPLRRSNLPALASYPIFFRNSIEWLTAAGASLTGRTWRPGESIVVRAAPGTERIELRGPEGEVLELPVSSPSRRVILPPLERRGVWVAEGAAPEDALLPVSQLSALESDLALGGEPPVTLLGPLAGARRDPIGSDLWPLLIAGALLLLLLEWTLWLIRAGRA